MEDRAPTHLNNPPASESPNPQEQLATAYDTYAGGLYRYALMILVAHSLAEDAVQQTFVKLAAQGKRISEITSRSGYLRTAVRNECYRILTRRKQTSSVNLEMGSILEPTSGEDFDEDLQHEIELAMRSLPPEQREVTHMKVYEQMTFQQIADELGISINTITSRWRYAIDKLRQILGRHCEIEDRKHD